MKNENLLSAWKNGSTKETILKFVDQVSRKGSKSYVPPEDRIAVFDNDGTLWAEKPMPIQADFLMREIRKQVERDPSLRTQQPWKAVYEKDLKWLSDVTTQHYRGDDHPLKILARGLLRAYEGVTIEEFETRAQRFLRVELHPTLHVPYEECAYSPMVELLKFLKENGFSNYIASGGGRDFMRAVSEKIYEIPCDRVIGSSVALEYRDTGDFAEIIHTPKLDLFDDGEAKPVRIWSRIGRRPILAAGNSNGDVPMLRFCQHPDRPSLSLLIDHDDDQREFLYREGAEAALREARFFGWTVVSVQNDWDVVFAQEPNMEVKYG